MKRGIAASIAILIAALAIAHPSSSADAVPASIAARLPAWLGIHAALLVAFPALAWRLGRHTTRWAQAALTAFAVTNTAYITLDGLVVGVLATTDPAYASAVWDSRALDLLANTVGALWAAALLLLAWTRIPGGQSTTVSGIAVALTWLSFTATAIPGGLPPLASRLIAAAAAALIIYRGGIPGLSAGLLTLAAVFRIHVGPEAALGLLLTACAELSRTQNRR